MGDPSDTPADPADWLTDLAREGLHIAVGLGVLAYQDLQVRRNQIEEHLAGSGDLDHIQALTHWLAGWTEQES